MVKIVSFPFECSDKHFRLLGEGLCYPGGCDIKNSSCHLNAQAKLQSNYEECRLTCLNITSCSGFAMMSPTHKYANTCIVYGEFLLGDTFAGWRPRPNMYFDVHTYRKSTGIQCYRKQGRMVIFIDVLFYEIVLKIYHYIQILLHRSEKHFEFYFLVTCNSTEQCSIGRQACIKGICKSK